MCAHLLEQKRLLASRLSKELGFHFPEHRLDDMWKRLEGYLLKQDSHAVNTKIDDLLDTKWDERIQSDLVSAFSIGETYFFRDPVLWDFCRQKMFPEFGRALDRNEKSTINIWSAACATGEEPYTVSLVLQQCLPPRIQDSFRIAASDINRTFLAHAQRGVYSKWSMRGISKEDQDYYFEIQENGSFKLGSKTQETVQFHYHNLVDPICTPPLSRCDLIICRNVFIYFNEQQITQIMQRLTANLVDGGWLVLSPQDVWYADRCPELEIVSLQDLILLRKKKKSGKKHTMNVTRNTLKKNLIIEQAKKDIEQQASSTLLPSQTVDEFKTQIQELFRKGDLDSALALSNQSIEVHSLSATLYYLKANIQEERGDKQAAIGCLRQALFLEPEFVTAHFALYNLQKKTGKEESAAVSYKNAIKCLEKLNAD